MGRFFVWLASMANHAEALPGVGGAKKRAKTLTMWLMAGHALQFAVVQFESGSLDFGS